jgi:hypothetical protein
MRGRRGKTERKKRAVAKRPTRNAQTNLQGLDVLSVGVAPIAGREDAMARPSESKGWATKPSR